MDLITAGVTAAVGALDEDGGADAARAIMTTDTVPKTAGYADEGWSVGGMAKGAGMLAPGLATMLVVITTDAVLDAEAAGAYLRKACSTTFERVDSDGCMSTNDTVVLMSSGASGVRPDARDFQAALDETCHDLALQLLRDAEGAAHDIAITCSTPRPRPTPSRSARAVARSNLFKCAVFGGDPNWGRVLAAIGTTAARLRARPDRRRLQRRRGVPRRRHRRGPRARWTCPAATCASMSTCGTAAARPPSGPTT